MTKKQEAEQKKAEKLRLERERIEGMKVYERAHPDCHLICGVDEAGRGPFAGPVVAGAVILSLDDPEREILYLNDSKKLSEKKREALYDEIMEKAVSVGVGIVERDVIDEINILQATFLAMQKAIAALDPQPDYILADAVTIPKILIPQEGIVKGDAKSVSIAAGSIIAKVTRDRIMYEYDKLYPEYGFASHKGYGTKAHIEAIKEYGMLDIHRRSFIHFPAFERRAE
ncbi:MAG: ribonuclease HII [Lachnospiraceae bacterium]|nr:ribonuclease HII [Lachnospiraceae bacterium]MBR6357979.1 ribonuclease HII [Lachnospiraceae bacterium]MBR7076195.1 ribonuclease HII [Lachnospiraceae bacterium]